MASYPWWMADQIEPGNIDLDISKRPSVKNGAGHSTVLSESGSDYAGGPEILYPLVVNGRILSSPEAWDYMKRTGKHLGKYRTVDAANAAGKQIHREQLLQAQLKGME